MPQIISNQSENRTTLNPIMRNPPRTLDTGIVDAKGRKIGAVAIRGVTDAMVGPIHKYRSYTGLPVGRHYWGYVQTTRDGEMYGAGQRACYFSTAEERDAYVEKRFDAVSAATLKKFGPN